jgi:4-amino-4-deoxy-L-arabinose transferase-like glycosyltransferase
LPVVVRLNLFSAVLSAGAHFFWFLIAHRALSGIVASARMRRLGAFAAVLLSATAFSVWNQSNVTEKVYTLSLFTIALVSWLLLRWRDSGHSPRWLLAAVFAVGLSSTSHLMGVLVAPAVITFVLLVQPRTVLRPKLWAGALVCIAVGLLPQFYLPYRAAQRPVLNETAPACTTITDAAASVYTWGRKGCPGLSAALRREQYGMPSFTLDPTVYPERELPRGPALFASQVGNYVQYFNWHSCCSASPARVCTGDATQRALHSWAYSSLRSRSGS